MATQSRLVPNSFQTPNILIDELDYYLTAQETKVLMKAVREILGWQDKIESRSARISLSVFENGKQAADGRILCHGCGLNKGTIKNALNALHRARVLLKVGKATNDGQLYTLQSDDTKIDWDWLNQRKDKKDAQNKKRTKKATIVAKTQREGGTWDDTPGGTWDDTPGGTWDDNKETQQKPSETQNNKKQIFEDDFDDLPEEVKEAIVERQTAPGWEYLVKRFKQVGLNAEINSVTENKVWAAYKKLSPPAGESIEQWVDYVIDAIADKPNTPGWNFVYTIFESITNSKSLATHKAARANGQDKGRGAITPPKPRELSPEKAAAYAQLEQQLGAW